MEFNLKNLHLISKIILIVSLVGVLYVGYQFININRVPTDTAGIEAIRIVELNLKRVKAMWWYPIGGMLIALILNMMFKIKK